jgi:hypothetical protein
MSRQWTPARIATRPSSGAKGFGVAGLAGAILVSTLVSAPASVEAAWVMPCPRPAQAVRSNAPDQSWLLDIPEKAGAHHRGKVAVFVFKGDDVYEPVRAAVVRTLRARGLNVTASLKPVDSAAQYRELSYTLNLAVYVEGELTGEGARQNALIHLRSGVTGQRIASAKFSGPTSAIVGAVGRGLWPRVGATMMRACSSASRPRRREREPMRIEAGTPLEEAPVASRGS